MTAMSKAIRSGRQCRKHGMTAVSKALHRMILGDSGLAKKRILDFGAGLAAVQTVLLRQLGLDVTAYDLPENRVEGGLHDPYALSRRYDIVMILSCSVVPVLRSSGLESTSPEALPSGQGKPSPSGDGR